jgi:hypothetical protein
MDGRMEMVGGGDGHDPMKTVVGARTTLEFGRVRLRPSQDGWSQAGCNRARPYCSSRLGLVNSFQYSTEYPNIQTKSNF